MSLTVNGGKSNGGDDRRCAGARRRCAQSAHQCRDRRITVIVSAAPQQTAKSETEILGAERVDERVDGGVAVAEPEEDDEQNGRRAVDAENSEDVDAEERRPADDEAANDDSNRLGGLLLAVQSPQLGSDLDEASAGVRLRRGNQLNVAAGGALFQDRSQRRLYETFDASSLSDRHCRHAVSVAVAAR